MIKYDFVDVKTASPTSDVSKVKYREKLGSTMEILKLMATGNLTLLEIARKLNLSREALKDRLRIMECTGHIETWYVDNCGSGDFCEFCSCARACSGSCPQILKIMAYRLTKKGERSLRTMVETSRGKHYERKNFTKKEEK